MKLKLLAEAASSFYGVPYEKLTNSNKSGSGRGRGPLAPAVSPIKVRHICQWVAKDAGYSESVIGRFWGRDPSSINHSCSKISRIVKSDDKEKRDLQLFLAHLRQHLVKAGSSGTSGGKTS